MSNKQEYFGYISFSRVVDPKNLPAQVSDLVGLIQSHLRTNFDEVFLEGEGLVLKNSQAGMEMTLERKGESYKVELNYPEDCTSLNGSTIEIKYGLRKAA